MIEQAVKKDWTEPELIVLVRNKPEEAVLVACKYTAMSGPQGVNGYCDEEPVCDYCSGWAVS